ncbi:MAG: glycosyltransferase N-terminal domain-containing protein [Chitinophagaceae bacterium]
MFNSKAKKWVTGREDIFNKLKKAIPADAKVIWIHCASLGEFEQGRPLIEKLRSQYKQYKILLTFFSPSGYEIQKKYSGADWIFYLPLDGARNANHFLDIVHPQLVIFVKYEYWYYYLKTINQRKIPLLLISALFTKDMIFFSWHGSLYRKMLSKFNHIFVQTPASKQLIDGLDLANTCSVAGDTRYDRVIEIAAASYNITEIEKFIGKSKCIIAGSTWPEDELVLQKAFSEINNIQTKLIIAPHEINEKHLLTIKALFPNCTFFSDLHKTSELTADNNVMIIDNIGMLSTLYKYAKITYVGGGLKPNGVHNVLEAAVYGKPVLFGPYYHKYAEAVELVKAGGGLPFTDEKRNGLMLKEIISALLINQEEYNYRCDAAEKFVESNRGATQIITQYIQENRLLTS